jgi:cysteine desulfurase
MKTSQIYLDFAATTPLSTKVREKMEPYFSEDYGNPSSMHLQGIKSERLIKDSKETIAKCLGVSKEEIFFTSGGTEANNLCILGYSTRNQKKGKTIITTKVEHPSVLECFRDLESKGFNVKYVGVDNKGNLDIKFLEDSIDKDTILISIMYVNNETGKINPIDKIVAIRDISNPNCKIHVDAIQAFGKLNIKPKEIGIDMISISGHKIHGPKGIGAVYLKKGLLINPIILGGGQEMGLRNGTQNISGICGFSKAAEIIYNQRERNYEYVGNLKFELIEKLNRYNIDYRMISDSQSIPHIVNIGFANIKAEVLLHFLEEKAIYISTGAACSSRKNISSHVIDQMNVEKKYSDGIIRVSFSEFNSGEEIDYFLENLYSTINRIKIK